MRTFKTLIFLASPLCLLFSGCTISQSRLSLWEGEYRWGADPNNSDYIVFSAGHEFRQFRRSNGANGMTVAPYDAAIASGKWQMKDGVIVLIPGILRDPKIFMRTLKIKRKQGLIHLTPVFGAGWSPEDGYVQENGDTPKNRE